MKTKKIITVLSLVILVVLLILLVKDLWNKKKGEQNMVMRIEGFEVEYIASDKKISIEDIESLRLGSTIYEIEDKLGEPNTWIGSGMLRPVYFLEDGGVAVCHFGYPAVLENLKEIVVFSKSGEKKIKLKI